MSVQDNHHLLTLLTDPLLTVRLLQGSLLLYMSSGLELA